ncbi:hypothetical protein [Bradyrhizobium sp. AUGA SZCCT0283]|uniref:hypothetical protein n=1 Tax=Bradyrhizobium sp. AUGA SZCCT0283 TaxID=2807671 RepID=UPI001BAB9A82|nr:hypothetical protein [Bradyrhizobium sp. AUGA SZCCT0283]MBR1279641.1 hypothetical protein [Bradyrhizobium sp. AUGA SZCCT0283]
MASNARIFFAGIGTSFLILAVGFSAGLMLAKSALHDPPAQNRTSEPSPAMRVILPASAEPAQQITAAAPAPVAQPQAQTGQEPQTQVAQKSSENGAQGSSIRDERAERRKRDAARKAKRIAAAKARQRMERQQPTEPGILAFGNDEPRISFFGN